MRRVPLAADLGVSDPVGAHAPSPWFAPARGFAPRGRQSRARTWRRSSTGSAPRAVELVGDAPFARAEQHGEEVEGVDAVTGSGPSADRETSGAPLEHGEERAPDGVRRRRWRRSPQVEARQRSSGRVRRRRRCPGAATTASALRRPRLRQRGRRAPRASVGAHVRRSWSRTCSGPGLERRTRPRPAPPSPAGRRRKDRRKPRPTAAPGRRSRVRGPRRSQPGPRRSRRRPGARTWAPTPSPSRRRPSKTWPGRSRWREPQRLPQRQLEHLLGPRRERDVAARRLGAAADDLLDGRRGPTRATASTRRPPARRGRRPGAARAARARCRCSRASGVAPPPAPARSHGERSC